MSVSALNLESQRTGGGDDQVERSSVGLDGIGCIATSSDESSGAHLLGVCLLALGMTDDGHIRSQSLGKDDGKVTETSQTDDTDILGGLSGTVLDQRRVDGSSSTEHGGGLCGVEVVGDRDDESGRTSPVVCVSTV